MPSTRELCFRLGFGDEFLCTRGSLTKLLNELKVFAQSCDPSRWATDLTLFDTEIEKITHDYLHVKDSGHAHWGSTLSNGHWNLLEWPLDAIK